ncbi:hypothetical protein MKW92_050610, partial [Papaver armeniacum]
MDKEAVVCAERATRIMLQSPDWNEVAELCKILKSNPGQTKDALEYLKTRLWHTLPRMQHLCLSVLETLCEHCGDQVFGPIVELGVLDNMVKIVQNKPDLSVREQILVLIDRWQESVGGSSGSFPQYYDVYQKLKLAGIDFPPREENSVPVDAAGL